MDFDQFQRQAKRTCVFKVQTPELRRHYLLAGLMEQVGEIANRLKKQLRDGADYVLLRPELKERIGYSLWYLTMLADELGLQLEDIAKSNVDFNNKRWYQMEEGRRLIDMNDFDGRYPEQEQLPFRLIAQFETKRVDSLLKTVVTMYPDWPSRDSKEQFGDPIDDNSTVEDHYRYHDVFHFAFVAHLWWSPVVRKLLKRKESQLPMSIASRMAHVQWTLRRQQRLSFIPM